MPPSVDVVRKRLGGRASTEAGAGQVVAIEREGAAQGVGVVLYVQGEEVHVWISETTVRRTQRASLKPLEQAPTPELRALAQDVQVFATLHEGQRIQFAEASGIEEGILVEKCRYGALVERADGKIFGIGFRKCWPAPKAGAAS